MSNLDSKEFTNWLEDEITAHKSYLKVIGSDDAHHDYAYTEGALEVYLEVLKKFQYLTPTPEAPTPELPRRFMRYGKVGWVTNYGEFGQENAVIVLEPNLLTRRQWRIVNEMHETDRYGYIRAIVDRDRVSIERYEEEHNE